MTGTRTRYEPQAIGRHGEIYAYPQVSEWALDDMFFDVGTWLAEEVAEEFAQERSVTAYQAITSDLTPGRRQHSAG